MNASTVDLAWSASSTIQPAVRHLAWTAARASAGWGLIAPLVTMLACTTPSPVTSTRATREERVAPAAAAAADDERVADDVPVEVNEASPSEPSPTSWTEALARWGEACPAPFFSLPTPEPRTFGGAEFLLHGSRLERVGPPPTGSLVIGVLGAIKDATADTRANLVVAAHAFRRADVDFVIVNGDVVGEAAEPVGAVLETLGEAFAVPVFLHVGNSEWVSAFSEAMSAASARFPHLVNMNMVRHVEWGGVHVVSLPGYHDRKFLRQGACHYDHDDVTALQSYVASLRDRGGPVVLTAHGPPLGAGPEALDVLHEGNNVGDAHISGLLRDGIDFGVFSHILESGGRALADVDATSLVAVPMKRPTPKLYVNVGAATSFAWGMLDGETSRGLAAILRVHRRADGADATVEFLKLRSSGR
jgi:hypothetical protein